MKGKENKQNKCSDAVKKGAVPSLSGVDDGTAPLCLSSFTEVPSWTGFPETGQEYR